MKSLLFLLFLPPLLAINYDFLHYSSNYQNALKKAAHSDKMLMLVLVQDHCPWCSQLAKVTLTQKKIKKKIQEEFIPILLNKNSDFIPQKYSTKFIPSIYFINPFEDEEVWRSSGYHDSKELLTTFKKALQSFKEDIADDME